MKYLQSRKARLVAGVAGAIMALGVASPAFANVGATNVGITDASQRVDVSQVNAGDAVATADDGSLAGASIDRSLTVNQTNGGFGDPFNDTGFFDDGDDDEDGVLDEYDSIILFGDHDNDGLVDTQE